MSKEPNTTDFNQLGLSPKILDNLSSIGYKTPTEIQTKAIPHVMMGRSVIGVAQTGTGKTAAFLLPIIDRLTRVRARARMPRVVILSPTRELSDQIGENFELYSKSTGLTHALLIGGVSAQKQEVSLGKGADVIIATPGRFIDLQERGRLMLHMVDYFVIDEADRMLDMGFIPDIEKINRLLPPKKLTLMFTATMEKGIRKIAQKFLSDPIEITVEPERKTAENVTQFYTRVASRSDKDKALLSYLREQDVNTAIIFCNLKSNIPKLKSYLTKHLKAQNILTLHGDLTQHTRNQRLDEFINKEAQYLICSDVMARGIDVDHISHVINYAVPMNPEDYVHRIGRTGRAGRKGTAFTLVEKSDEEFFDKIKTLIEKPIKTYDVLKKSKKPHAEKTKQKNTSSSDQKNKKDNQSKGFGDHTPEFLKRSF